MSGADPAHVAAGVEGRTISRGVGRPVPIPGGWCVEVGRPDQVRRFVFPAAGEAVRHPAEAHGGPHVFIKAVRAGGGCRRPVGVLVATEDARVLYETLG